MAGEALEPVKLAHKPASSRPEPILQPLRVGSISMSNKEIQYPHQGALFSFLFLGILVSGFFIGAAGAVREKLVMVQSNQCRSDRSQFPRGHTIIPLELLSQPCLPLPRLFSSDGFRLHSLSSSSLHAILS